MNELIKWIDWMKEFIAKWIVWLCSLQVYTFFAAEVEAVSEIVFGHFIEIPLLASTPFHPLLLPFFLLPFFLPYSYIFHSFPSSLLPCYNSLHISNHSFIHLFVSSLSRSLSSLRQATTFFSAANSARLWNASERTSSSRMMSNTSSSSQHHRRMGWWCQLRPWRLETKGATRWHILTFHLLSTSRSQMDFSDLLVGLLLPSRCESLAKISYLDRFGSILDEFWWLLSYFGWF